MTPLIATGLARLRAGAAWVAKPVRRSCERIYFDPVRVQMDLAMLARGFENGDFGHDRFRVEEERLLSRLKAISEKRMAKELEAKEHEYERST